MKPVLGVDVSLNINQPVDAGAKPSYSVQATRPFKLDDHTVVTLKASYDFKKTPTVNVEIKRKF
eukprot:CAMPEP_0196659872 /NCGR_PEP_ID=MMETSP1086-20130531/36928_1 /TAXON_ID=77921 /ORGANISM="Cyanoptyche  gloeocystis , Strain SAG4.97" /LENGTH=63 /DNA_ID=CAMNT_0041994013 /DNA_START=82 /DNA_END=273 /DNA_ORIENTATION=-